MAQPACIDYAEPSSGQLSLAQALRAERPATLQKTANSWRSYGAQEFQGWLSVEEYRIAVPKPLR